MTVYAHFVRLSVAGEEDEWQTLFNATVDALPRIGETVCYSHRVLCTEEAEWSPEALDQSKDLGGRLWTVRDVYHEYQRYRLRDPLTPAVWVVLRPKDAP